MGGGWAGVCGGGTHAYVRVGECNRAFECVDRPAGTPRHNPSADCEPTWHCGPAWQCSPCMQWVSEWSYTEVHPSFASSASTITYLGAYHHIRHTITYITQSTKHNLSYFWLSSSTSISKNDGPMHGERGGGGGRCGAWCACACRRGGGGGGGGWGCGGAPPPPPLPAHTHPPATTHPPTLPSHARLCWGGRWRRDPPCPLAFEALAGASFGRTLGACCALVCVWGGGH